MFTRAQDWVLQYMLYLDWRNLALWELSKPNNAISKYRSH